MITNARIAGIISAWKPCWFLRQIEYKLAGATAGVLSYQTQDKSDNDGVDSHAGIRVGHQTNTRPSLLWKLRPVKQTAYRPQIVLR